MWFLLLISIVFLGAITWFDFRDRSIPLALLIGESVVALLYFSYLAIPGYFFTVLINLLLAGFNIGLLFVWFKWRHGRISFFDKILGWGDVFLFGIAALFFEPMNFWSFIVIAAFLGGVYGAAMYFVSHNSKRAAPLIPLAGIMAALLIVSHLFHFFGVDLI